MIFEQRLEEGNGLSHVNIGGRTFQTQGKARAKALGWAYAHNLEKWQGPQSGWSGGSKRKIGVSRGRSRSGGREGSCQMMRTIWASTLNDGEAKEKL